MPFFFIILSPLPCPHLHHPSLSLPPLLFPFTFLSFILPPFPSPPPPLSSSHKTPQISFHNRWITNRERLTERILRNADLLFIPQHNFASIKRMPMFNPSVWNEEGPEKYNPNQHIYLRNVKRSLLQSLIFYFCNPGLDLGPRRKT
jgi:hypothetical protein